MAAAATAQERHESKDAGMIPQSVKSEHEEIVEALDFATRVSGPVGTAASELAAVMRPHFEREEEIALPPLGMLERLSRGERCPDQDKVLLMTDALRAELPRMLEEHEAIGAAALRLEEVAQANRNPTVQKLARKLQLHARSEEEVFYPAALLVGDVIRLRDR